MSALPKIRPARVTFDDPRDQHTVTHALRIAADRIDQQEEG